MGFQEILVCEDKHWNLKLVGNVERLLGEIKSIFKGFGCEEDLGKFFMICVEGKEKIFLFCLCWEFCGWFRFLSEMDYDRGF